VDEEEEEEEEDGEPCVIQIIVIISIKFSARCPSAAVEAECRIHVVVLMSAVFQSALKFTEVISRQFSFWE
jgi:hypothetical protein